MKDIVVNPYSALGVVTTPRDEDLIEQALNKGHSLRCVNCGGCKFNVRGITLSIMVMSLNGTSVVYKQTDEETRATRILDCAECGGTDIEVAIDISGDANT